MKVLITGVGGLLGSRLADHLLKKGHIIIGIDNMSGGYDDNINSDIDLYYLDLSDDLEKLDSIFLKLKPDYVYHMAAYAAEGLSPFIRSYNYTNNLISTANIVTQCIKHDVKRLVFTSSMSVYGRGPSTPEWPVKFDESFRRMPIDPYGIAKAACEMDIEVAGEQHGLDWCIIRPHNVYGIGQNIWDKYRNVLGIWMYKALNNLPLLIYGDGQQTRAFSYIDDSLEPLWKAAIEPSASKEIINLGGIKESTILHACMTLIDVMGGDHEIEFCEPRHEVKNAVPTWQKSVDLLDFEHKIDLKDGLAEMWEWAKGQPNRKQKVWEEYELDKNIYSYWRT